MIIGRLLSLADHVELLNNAIDNEGDHRPVAKFFTPDANVTWLISEVGPDDPDRLFGLCDLGLGEPELGWVSLTELSALKGPLGLSVERHIHFSADKPLSAYAREARAHRRIIA